jgi:hypothetical protein
MPTVPEIHNIHHWARHQWLTPTILATQEAEIRRILVESQPWASNSRDPILKKKRAGRMAQAVIAPP